MTEHNQKERNFIATTQLYRDIDTLPLRFLRRNLNHILNSHDRLRRGEDNAAGTIAADEVRRRARWEPPTEPLMDKYIDADKPRLTIDSFFLRPHGSHFMSRDLRESHAHSSAEDSPDWLPHPDHGPINCQVWVYIHYKHLAETKIYRDTRKARIWKLELAGTQPVFDVRLQSPFVIEADQLNINKELMLDDETKYWERTMTDRYTLEIGISCLNMRDAGRMLAQIHGGKPSDYADSAPNESTFRAIWGDPNTDTISTDPGLPALPSDKMLLRLRRTHGNESSDLAYGLQPKMSWNTAPGDSILSTYNKQLRRLRSARQMPTPSPSEDMEPPRKRRCEPGSIRYQFRQGVQIHRSVHMKELKCIFCPNDREHSSIERLYGHYATHHEHFSIDVEEDEEDVSVSVFKMELKEELRDSSKDTPTTELNWQSNGELFDAREYMIRHTRGEDTGWELDRRDAGQKVSQLAPRQTQAKARRAGQGVSVASDLELPQTKRKEMPPEAVQDLPTRKRRRHAVPAVPGIDFYRTTSKQVLVPGVLISDSDEDPDESWLLQRQRRDLRKLGGDDFSRELHEMINRHLDEERPQSDLLMRDAMVRFTRKYKHRLTAPTMHSVFKEQLERLVRGRVIKQLDLNYCLKVVSKSNLDEDVETSDLDEDDLHPLQPTSQRSATQFVPSAPSSGASRGKRGILPTSRTDRTPQSSKGPLIEAATQSRANRLRRTPLGKCSFICRRSSGSKQKPYNGTIKELIQDDMTHIPLDDIQPRHLDWLKFCRILDNDFVYIRPSDTIVCISNRLAPLVTDREDWYRAIEQAADQPEEFGDGTLIFELHTSDSYQQLMGSAKCDQEDSARRTAAGGLGEAGIVHSRRLPCDCGELVTSGGRGTIGCANSLCRRNYHMGCVGLQKRPLDWKCSSCSA